MARRLGKILKKVPYWEALRAFLEQWGIWKWIVAGAAAVFGALTAAWAWLESHLPAWGMAVLFLVVLVLIIVGANYAVELFRKVRSERIDHNKVADSLIELSNEMSRVINDYLRDQARRNYPPPSRESELDTRQQWQIGITEGNLLVRHVQEKFGARIMASVILLSKLGVPIPFHLSHIHSSTVMALASYLGAVGNLIKNDQLAVAQKVDDKIGWTLSGIGG